MTVIIPPVTTYNIVDSKGNMTQLFRVWTQLVSNLGLIVGTGSPEGVVAGVQGQEYMDDTGTPGNIKYIKRDAAIGGDATLGWILI